MTVAEYCFPNLESIEIPFFRELSTVYFKMVATNIAFTAAINPAGASPVLTREQVWAGLQKKTRAAHDFAGGAILSTEVLSETSEPETGYPVVEREVTFAQGDRKVKEFCTEFAPTKIDCRQPDGSNITNVISVGSEREMYLSVSLGRRICWHHTASNEMTLTMLFEI